jgi:hypothetical protein
MSAVHPSLAALAVLAALLLSPGLGAADARLAERFTSGPWKGAAYLDAETGEFSHCAVYATYEGDQVLVLLRTEDGFSVGVADPAWRLEPGARYEFLMGIDARWARTVSGHVPGEQVVRVDFGDDPETVQAFREGESLTVVARMGVFRFALAGTEAALADLEGCYARRRQGTAVDLARAPASPSPEEASAGQARAERLPDRLSEPRLSLADFHELARLAALGSGESGVPYGALGFAHYYFLLPERALALYWEEDASHSDADAILRRALGLWASECQARVETGTIAREERERARIRQGFVRCEQSEVAGYVAVTVVDFGTVAQVLAVAVEVEAREVADGIARRFYEIELGSGTVSAALERARPQSVAALKLSHSASAPPSSPRRNQRTRWAALPWVKESGAT